MQLAAANGHTARWLLTVSPLIKEDFDSLRGADTKSGAETVSHHFTLSAIRLHQHLHYISLIHGFLTSSASLTSAGTLTPDFPQLNVSRAIVDIIESL